MQISLVSKNLRSLFIKADGTVTLEPSGAQVKLSEIDDPVSFMRARIDDELGELQHMACDVTSNCNLRCPYCINDFADASAKRMTPELFGKIIELAPLCLDNSVLISCLCEPLLHPQLLDLVHMIPAELSHKFTMTTNLSTKRLDEEFFRRLASSPIHHLNVSVDSLRKETFESLRVNAKFEVFMHNLKLASAAFQEHEGLPELKFITVVSKTNYAEVADVIRRTHDEFGIDFHEVRHLFEQGTPSTDWLYENALTDGEWDSLVEEMVQLPYQTNVTRDAALAVAGFGKYREVVEAWGVSGLGDEAMELTPAIASPVPMGLAVALQGENQEHLTIEAAEPTTALGVVLQNLDDQPQDIRVIAKLRNEDNFIVSICETDPADGSCQTPPARYVSSHLGVQASSTFSVFVRARHTAFYGNAEGSDELSIQIVDSAGRAGPVSKVPVVLQARRRVEAEVRV